jgi:hypothetical protein
VQALIFFSCLGGLISFVWLLALISNDINEQLSRATNSQQSGQDGHPDRPFFHWVKRLIGLYGEPERSISDENGAGPKAQT